MNRRLTVPVLTAAAALGLVCLSAAPAAAHGDRGDRGGDVATNVRAAQVETTGAGKAMKFVANLQYDKTGKAQNGSDIEFVRLGDKEYALAGTLRGGMHIVDITNPRTPKRVAVYDCKISQGDIQVWRNGSRVLASYTADGTFGEAGATSTCGRDLRLTSASSGTVIVDITRPARPATVSFLSVPRGSHNQTIHPSGKYLYNSNSDLITSTSPTITIYDISKPAQPRKVQDFPIPFVPASLGSESHDITFNASGTRAYSAALSQTLVLDTTNPAAPKIVSQIIDPQVNVSHQADPVTLTRKDGTKRTVLIVTDERAGAAASAECPGGGLHLYDVTGDKEKSPAKIGTWFIPTAKPQDGGTCTSHVLRVYPKQKMATIAWYTQGVRVLDIAGLADFAGGPTSIGIGDGVGIKEIGNYVLADSDTWSFKTNKINKDGSFYGYGNDLVRGFDVYRFDGSTIGTVPEYRLKDLKPTTTTSSSTTVMGSLAVAVPTLLLSFALRRRTRRED